MTGVDVRLTTVLVIPSASGGATNSPLASISTVLTSLTAINESYHFYYSMIFCFLRL
jgi:hypothetical protein